MDAGFAGYSDNNPQRSGSEAFEGPIEPSGALRTGNKPGGGQAGTGRPHANDGHPGETTSRAGQPVEHTTRSQPHGGERTLPKHKTKKHVTVTPLTKKPGRIRSGGCAGTSGFTGCGCCAVAGGRHVVSPILASVE